MHTELRTLIFQAEEDYLQEADLDKFKVKVSTLADRLTVYEIIRENEVLLFQSIVDRLMQDKVDRDPKIVERAISNWISILRYCSMAMLLNDTEYLQSRLLEWLTEQVKAHQLQAIGTEIYQMLQARLKKLVSAEQFALFLPFLEEAKKTLLS